MSISNGGAFFGTADNIPVGFGNNDAFKLYIATNGNIGVLTTTPSTWAMYVNGDHYVADTLKVENVIYSPGKAVVEDSLRVGTSTPAKINSNGSFTGLNVSNFDTVKTKKLRFDPVSNNPMQPGSMTWDSLQRTFKAWQFIVERSFAMNHNILIDSQYVNATTTETALDTIIMGANYPVVGKYVQTFWTGEANAAAGSSKTFKFRIKKGTTVIDSISYVTPPGGSTSQDVEIINTINFKTVGSSGRIHSHTKATTENGVSMNSNYATINTTTENLIILTLEISDNAAGNNFKLEQGLSTTIN